MKNWSLNQKIWSIVCGLALAFVITVGMSIHSLVKLRDSLNNITGNVVKRDQLTSEIKDNQRRYSINALESIVFTKPEQLKRNQEEFGKINSKIDEDIESYRALASEKGKAILSDYSESLVKFREGLNKTREFGMQNKNDEASAAYTEVRENVVPSLRKAIDELNALTATQLKELSQTANEDAANAIWLSIAIFLVSITLSLLTSFFILKALTRAIAEIVRSLSDGSLQVTSASAQIASASEELSQSATEQAASLEETAASVEEMNSMISKNSENATSTASLSQKSTSASERGQTVVGKMMNAMTNIDKSNATIMDQITESNKQIAGIVTVVEQIAKKTQVINDIVNKTELLSFNASVEAARAGEHGKGFAVVAEEVGNLARMSGSAAEEITTLIEGSIVNVNKIVQETASKVGALIDAGKRSVAEGIEVSTECGEVLREIVGNVKNVSSMSNEIATASSEQSRGIAEITKAMNQLDQMTQQNAATSEECASAAEELSAQAESLKNTVTQLVRTVNGQSSQGMADAPAPAAAKAPVKRAAPAASPKGNVVKLGGRPAAHPEPLKKAAGDTPDYDHEGFRSI